MNYDDGANGAEEYAEEEEEEELTHEDIWDDSALIDAWNSATAEYEVSDWLPSAAPTNVYCKAYHGKIKKWKAEPVKRSPL